MSGHSFFIHLCHYRNRLIFVILWLIFLDILQDFRHLKEVGAGLDDLGKGLRSQTGTLYSTLKKGPRYLELAEGYVTKLGLDKENRVIGYEVVQLGKVMEAVRAGKDANEAIKANTSTKGRFADAVKTIDPREE